MFGARDYSMRIWLRPDRMNALNITTDDVARALREQNVQGAAGQVGTPPVFNGQQQTLTINGLGRLNEAASFGEIIIRRGAQGQLVRLADVATIELGARSYSSGAQLNGKKRRPIWGSIRRPPPTPCRSPAQCVRSLTACTLAFRRISPGR